MAPSVAHPAGAGWAAGRPIALNPNLLLSLQVLAALTIAPLVNLLLFAFGEEFGWRGYLLPKLMALTSPHRAVVVTGVVWGCWHWPVFLMGYEYGFGYRGAPWTGLLLFCTFTVAVGTVLSWLTLRSGSTWPAALGHASLNASAGLPLAFSVGTPTPLLGPVPVGAIAMAEQALAAASPLTSATV